MDRIVIKGIPPYDGEHPIDSSYFTNRELHTIKRLSGVRGGELNDALDAGDSDLVVSLAVIALQRNGFKVVEDAIWDAQVGSIDFLGDPAERDGDAVVPPPVRADWQPATVSETTGSSGNGSNGTSESPVADRSPTGSPRSDSPATSVSGTSAS